MRAFCIVLLAMSACAHIEAPPGGPQDSIPPALLLTRPDTLAVVTDFTGPATLVFEDRLSERGVEESVLISPLTSAPDVDHRGNEIRVRLRRGWEPGRIYQITVLPGLQDLWNNRIGAPTTLTFSTGPAIPNTRVGGVVRDRITGRPEVGTRVEAVLRPDSLVYSSVTDSTGAWSFARIPEGPYGIRAYRDLNRNRILDGFEANDTASATLRAGAAPGSIQLAVLPADTTAPKLAAVEPADSLVELRFDDFLDPEQSVSAGQVTITAPGGRRIGIAAVRLATGRATGQDSLRVLPTQTLSVRPAESLLPQTEYRVQAERVRNVRGLLGGGEATLRTPAPPAAPAPARPPNR